MPNDARPLLLRLLMVTGLVMAVAGCSLVGASASAILGSGPLVTVTTRGGECMDGPCGSTVTIERDGTVHEAAKPPNELGTVSPELLTALDAAVKTADFTAIRAVAFTGECPTAYDGQETIYEFGAPGGLERVASCETAIDPANPVFAATTAALVAVGVLAAP
ncbi:MAG TPA: hypothetical protein VFW02_09285 [Candidatus Limnocylindrales bacterium]|nr:hypothetical protein [Candidatus Limnocylindrales bacterium]